MSKRYNYQYYNEEIALHPYISPEEHFKENKSVIHTFVAELNGKCVGTIGFCYKDSTSMKFHGLDFRNKKIAELKRMYVHTDYHKKGIGCKLYQRLEDFLIKNKYDGIFLITTKYQLPACKFYEKVGFKLIEEDSFVWYYSKAVIYYKSIKDQKFLS